MRRLSFSGLLGAIAWLGACSILNAPADVIPGSGGSSTFAQLSTSSVGASSSSSSSSGAPATCQGAQDGALCDDGLYCTVGDTCQAGKCVGSPRSCPARDKCNVGVCDESSKQCASTPGNEGGACDDGLFCTVGDTCKSGYCVGTPYPCPAGNGPCVKGTCDETTKSCVTTPIANGGACNSGNACTAGETCSNGVCTGGTSPVVIFSETFADNSKGWVLGPEWQIGHAAPSFGQEAGNPDPGADYTGEGGVAGIVIGGNAAVASPNPTHPFEYLTSPAIDTTKQSPLYLTFYRWLNSDYAPFMVNTVEISTDGTTWTPLWQSAGMPIIDGQWTFQSIDISAHQSPSTRFRFGMSIGNPMVFRVSSWNLDKVEVQNAPCPK